MRTTVRPNKVVCKRCEHAFAMSDSTMPDALRGEERFEKDWANGMVSCRVALMEDFAAVDALAQAGHYCKPTSELPIAECPNNCPYRLEHYSSTQDDADEVPQPDRYFYVAHDSDDPEWVYEGTLAEGASVMVERNTPERHMTPQQVRRKMDKVMALFADTRTPVSQSEVHTLTPNKDICAKCDIGQLRHPAFMYHAQTSYGEIHPVCVRLHGFYENEIWGDFDIDRCPLKLEHFILQPN